MQSNSGALTRDFDLEAYLGMGPIVELALDASPWGLGGVLIIDNKPVSYFASQLSTLDFRRFEFEPGSPNGQQCWECLCALVALRLYRSRWKQKRIRLVVRGDSYCMLSLLLKLRPPTSSPSLGLIAREIALDISESVYTPDLATHVPGMSNTFPDALSREHEPGKQFVLPDALLHVPREEVPERDDSFYRTM